MAPKSVYWGLLIVWAPLQCPVQRAGFLEPGRIPCRSRRGALPLHPVLCFFTCVDAVSCPDAHLLSKGILT